MIVDSALGTGHQALATERRQEQARQLVAAIVFCRFAAASAKSRAARSPFYCIAVTRLSDMSSTLHPRCRSFTAWPGLIAGGPARWHGRSAPPVCRLCFPREFWKDHVYPAGTGEPCTFAARCRDHGPRQPALSPSISGPGGATWAIFVVRSPSARPRVGRPLGGETYHGHVRLDFQQRPARLCAQDGDVGQLLDGRLGTTPVSAKITAPLTPNSG